MASSTPSTVRLLGQLSTIGMSFVLALVLGFGGGLVLDNWLGSKPWLMFLGFFLGLAAGVLNVYRVMREADKLSRQSGQGVPTSTGPTTTRRED
ncbi:MAG: AtpZ/AtpI family protein [Vicinamibacterales bacterium]